MEGEWECLSLLESTLSAHYIDIHIVLRKREIDVAAVRYLISLIIIIIRDIDVMAQKAKN